MEAQVTVKVVRSAFSNLLGRHTRARARLCSPATFTLENPDRRVIYQDPPDSTGKLVVRKPVWINFNFVNSGPFVHAELRAQQIDSHQEDPAGQANFPWDQQSLINGGKTLRVRARHVHPTEHGRRVWAYCLAVQDSRGRFSVLDPDIENEN